MTPADHIRKAREYERFAAELTVRGHQHIQSPEPYWDLAVVHRRRALLIREARP